MSSGTLAVSDVDHNATHTWTVAGGIAVHAADYSFAIDSFTITRANTAIFSDDFSSAPSTATGYSVGANGIAGTLTNGTDANGPHRPFLDAAHAIAVTGIGTTTPYVSDSATALTGSNPNGATTLTKETDFSVVARFDLIAPNDLGEGYGIRLSDRQAGPATGSNGDDAVDLRVTQANNGSVVVSVTRHRLHSRSDRHQR